MEGDPIRVLIADDEEDMRVLLDSVIAEEDDMEVVGAAKDAEEAVEMAAAFQPDVAVLDWMMPGGGGRAAKGIIERSPGTRIIAFTAGDPMHASYDMMGAGATGMLSKSASNEEIIAGIRGVLRF